MKNMRNRNWNHEFPEVPEHVHKIVLSTLAELEDGKVKKVKQMKKGLDEGIGVFHEEGKIYPAGNGKK